MNKNLKLLDKFDKNANMYELICKLARKTHSIINGAGVSTDSKEYDPIRVVMEEASGDEKTEK